MSSEVYSHQLIYLWIMNLVITCWFHRLKKCPSICPVICILRIMISSSFTYRIKIINTIILEFGTFGHILVTEFHFLNLMFSYFIRIEFHLLNQCFYIGIIFILRIEFLTGLETWTTAASITRTRDLVCVQ